MNIVYVTARLPYPPHRGDSIRALQQIQELVKLGHQVHLLSFSRADHAPPELAKLVTTVQIVPFSLPRAVARACFGFVRGQSAQMSYFAQRDMRSALNALVVVRG